MTIALLRIDFGQGLVTTCEHEVLQIADLFDARGRTTAVAEEAVACFAGRPGSLLFFELRPFDRKDLQ